MKVVPNQKVITIKKSPTDRKHLYTTNNIQAIFEAMYNLKSLCGFKLYMYLAKNQNNFEVALSSKDFCESANCSMTAYNTAVKELITKGYLVQKIEGNNMFYTFFDRVSNREELIETKEVEKIEEPKEIDLTTYKPKVIERTLTREELYASQGFVF